MVSTQLDSYFGIIEERVTPEGYNLTNLKSLYIIDTKLDKNIPIFKNILLNLEELHLNSITDIPNWIGNLNNLTSLTINNSNLDSLPEWIASLTNLENLSLSDNKLLTLPKWINQLTQLEFLTLEGNPLTTLPQSITDINCLQIQWNHDMVFSPSELIDHLNTSHLKQLIAKGKI